MSTDTSLQDDAVRLEELNRAVFRALVESNTDELGTALMAYMRLRKSLKTRMLDESAIAIENAHAATILRKISAGDGLPSDRVIEQLAAKGTGGISFGDFDENELADMGSELFYSWFSHHEYIRGLAELRPLIIRAAVPRSVSQLVGQVKNCYAFQQYEAAYALCRTVIEASVRDICVRCHLLPTLKDDEILFEKHNWGKLRDKVSAPGPLRDQLGRLYGDLSTVVHGRKSVSKDEARRAFEETLQVVERLYNENGL